MPTNLAIDDKLLNLAKKIGEHSAEKSPMKVIVDTCVWSQVLHRNSSKNQMIINELTELIRDVRVQLIGPIRQEILSGIKSEKQYNKLL